jgi:uncharacterized metal-binding protein
MTEVRSRCAACGLPEKICRSEAGKGPAGCPTREEEAVIEETLPCYDQPEFREFARIASIQEAECYTRRDASPFVMLPAKTRIEEVVEFSGRMGYRKLGLAFCAGLAREAGLVADIFEKRGFEIVSVVCKAGGIPKERIGIRDEEKVRIGTAETMCNPIAQAGILNRAGTEFNLMLGLCVGHDALFLKHAEALTTVLAVKDRVLGHNPLAALYTAHSYYERLLKKV